MQPAISVVPSSFQQFWSQYPRKTAKKVAQHSWLRLTDKEQQVALEALPKHVLYWQHQGTEPNFIPHASTWLNQERWTDELPEVNQVRSLPWWKQGEQGIAAEFKRRGKEIPPGKSWEECRAMLMSQA